MSVIIAMCLFSLSMSITPGPVNLMSLSTAANYGCKRAMPFVSGATIGFTLLLLLVGLTIGAATAYSAIFLKVLTISGAFFIGYVGFNVITSKPAIEVKQQKIPSFYQGFLLQWLNPKAWIACVSGVSAFHLTGSYLMLATFISLYFCICYASMTCWALAGGKVKLLLSNPKSLRIFNVLMGAALIFVAIYLLTM